MSNKLGILNMPRIKRTEMVLDRFYLNDDQRKLADAGLQRLKDKEVARSRRSCTMTNRKGQFVVQDVREGIDGLGVHFKVTVFMTKKYDSNGEVLFSTTSNWAFFDSELQAEIARDGAGRGQVVAVSDVNLSCDALSCDHLEMRFSL